MTDLLYRVVEPFVIYGKDGNRETFALSNEVFTADHPAVKKRPASFGVVTPRGVERATKAPGEKRAVTPPKAARASKAATPSNGRRGRRAAGDGGVETATAEPGEKRAVVPPNESDAGESKATTEE